MLYVLWALVGWCGTPWPRRWPPPPPPPPDGDPWFTKIVNMVGGLAGGWAYTQLWALTTPVSAMDAAASCVGALVGAVLLGDVVGLFKGSPKAGGTRAAA